MNKLRTASALAMSVLVAMASTVALAQDRDHRGGPPERHDAPHGGPDRGGPGRDMHGHDDHDGRGGGPNHDWHRGGRLPTEYRSHQYVVDDWRGHHLSAPPRGYHWVQAGPDYVLAAIATGVIAQVLLGN